MKQMSFALTTAQVRARTKTVTRRLGWQTAKVGQLVQPIVKGQGLKKGQHVEPIGGPIRFTSVRLEPLSRVTFADCAKEGFHGMEPCEFVEMFSRHNGCQPDDIVTRIEFQYLGASPGASHQDDFVLRVLVLRWRAAADALSLKAMHRTRMETLRACANELEETLAAGASPGASPAPQKC